MTEPNGTSPTNGHRMTSSQEKVRRKQFTKEQRAFLWNSFVDQLEQQKELTTNLTAFSRTWFQQMADPRRNLYEECGWPADPSTGDGTGISIDLYKTLYLREPLATRVVELMPKECWQQTPTVWEDEDAEKVTPFEEAWDALGSQIAGRNSWNLNEQGSLVWHYLQRLDIVSGIGSFGVLLLGVDDGKNLQEPLDGVMVTNSAGESFADGPMTVDEEHSLLNPAPRWKAGVVGGKAMPGLFGPPRGIPVSEDKLGATPLSEGQKIIVNQWAAERDRDWTLNASGMFVRNANPKGINQYTKGGLYDESKWPNEGEFVVIHRPGTESSKTGAASGDEGGFYVRDSGGEVGPHESHEEAVAYGQLGTGDKHVGTFKGRQGGSTTTNASSGMFTRKAGQHDRRNATRDRGMHNDVNEPTVDRARDSSGRAVPGVGEDAKTVSPYEAGRAGFDPTDPANPGPMRANDPHEVYGTDAQYDDVGYGLGMPPPAAELGYSLSGTDEQYFGVQFGPSEQPAPPTEPGMWQDINPSTLGDGVNPDLAGRFNEMKRRQAERAGTVKRRPRLLFLRPYGEDLVQIVRYEWNIRNPRFGQPVMYRITLTDPSQAHGGVGLPLATVFVHWSRVIHVADNLRGASDVFGIPRMQQVLNPILDVQKVRGAGAEGYWKSCFTGLQFVTHPELGGDVMLDEQSLSDSAQAFQNSLQRILTSRGGSWQTIAPSVVDPSPHIAAGIEAICIALGCPVPVFKGYEIGEQASTNNAVEWNKRKHERCQNHITPMMIAPLADRLIQIGVLPQPGDAKAKVNNIRRTQPWTRVERHPLGNGWLVHNWRRPTRMVLNAAPHSPMLERLRDAARHIRQIPGAMPGYGQLWWNKETLQAWYVGGDGDETDFYKAVVRLLQSVKGVKSVVYEAEAFPPKSTDGEWVQIAGIGTKVTNAVPVSIGDLRSRQAMAMQKSGGVPPTSTSMSKDNQQRPAASADARAKTGQAGGTDGYSKGDGVTGAYTAVPDSIGPADPAEMGKGSIGGWTPPLASTKATGGAQPWEAGMTGTMTGQASTLFIADAGYTVEWPDVEALGKQAKATLALTYTQALTAYQQAGAEALMDFHTYLVDVWGWTDEQAEACIDATKQMHADQDTLGTPPMVAGQPAEAAEGTQAAADAKAKADQAKQQADALKQAAQMKQPQQGGAGAAGQPGAAANPAVGDKLAKAAGGASVAPGKASTAPNPQVPKPPKPPTGNTVNANPEGHNQYTYSGPGGAEVKKKHDAIREKLFKECLDGVLDWEDAHVGSREKQRMIAEVRKTNKHDIENLVHPNTKVVSAAGKRLTAAFRQMLLTDNENPEGCNQYKPCDTSSSQESGSGNAIVGRIKAAITPAMQAVAAKSGEKVKQLVKDWGHLQGLHLAAELAVGAVTGTVDGWLMGQAIAEMTNPIAVQRTVIKAAFIGGVWAYAKIRKLDEKPSEWIKSIQLPSEEHGGDIEGAHRHELAANAAVSDADLHKLTNETMKRIRQLHRVMEMTSPVPSRTVIQAAIMKHLNNAMESNHDLEA